MENLRNSPALQLILAILALAMPTGLGLVIAVILVIALAGVRRYDILSKISWWVAWFTIVMAILGLIFGILGFAVGLVLLPFRIVFGLLFSFF